MKQEIVALNVIMVSKYNQTFIKTYLYTDDGCVQKFSNIKIEDLEENYCLIESYRWHFKDENSLKEMLHKTGVSGYYGTEKLEELNLYTIRSLNYTHTGIGMKRFRKGYMYITDEDELYWCVHSGDKFTAKFVSEADIKDYHPIDSFYKFQYVISNELRLSIRPIIKTIINEVGEVIIGTYKLTKDNEIVFM